MPNKVTGTLFSDIASLCVDLESTSKRNEKVKLISSFLKSLTPPEIAPAIRLTIGRVFSEDDARTLNVGFKTLSKTEARAGQSTLASSPLTILRIERCLGEIARLRGKESQKKKETLLAVLLSELAPQEREYLLRSLLGEMRHGVVEGVMADAIAHTFSIPVGLVERAYGITGDLGKVATIARVEGVYGLQRMDIELFHPVRPMLAEASDDLEDVITQHGGTTALEPKFDGARIQVHKGRGRVAVFSRRLADVTHSLPEVVETITRRVQATTAILEGEIVAEGEGSRPLPFQDLMRRFRRIHNVKESAAQTPVALYVFDVLYADGRSLLAQPYQERFRVLDQICDSGILARREITSDIAKAHAVLRTAIEAGHEGVMAKALGSTYRPGKRTKDWLKVKKAETLDVIIIAADWGSGRRRGWLSNYHLAAYNNHTQRYVVIGKTFKGLTDQEFKQMTRRLQSIAVSEDEFTVNVKPQVVVEVTFNEIQSSPTYASGYSLRFARITRIREDKSAEEADTIDKVETLFNAQLARKGRRKHEDI